MSRNLVEEVATALGPMGVWQELHPYLESLEKPTNGRVEVRALCPFHDDHHPSWCWNLEKGVAHCFVCGKAANSSFIRHIAEKMGQARITVLDRYCRRFHLKRPRSRILTVEAYAAAKNLPVTFLADRFCLGNNPNGLCMPYFDAERRIIAHRIRRRIGEKPRWPKGTSGRDMVYGLHGLGWIGQGGCIYVVEGESDLHTAWYHDVPALAVPGATMGHRTLAEIVKQIEPQMVCVLPDQDKSGSTMLEELDKALKIAEWTGEFLAAMLPAKDLSDLQLKQPERLPHILDATVSRARPVEQIVYDLKNREQEGDSTMMRVFRQLRSMNELTPAAKMIVMAAAEAVAHDPRQRIALSKSRLARAAGVGRHTLYDNWSHLLSLGLFEEDDGGNGFCLGASLVG